MKRTSDMKRFITHLLETIRTPTQLVDLAQRFSKRQIDRLGHLPRIERPERADALYIRTPNLADPARREQIFRALSDTEDRLMGPPPDVSLLRTNPGLYTQHFTRGREIVRAAEKDKILPIKLLRPTQAHVEVTDPEVLQRKITGRGEKPPRVFEHEGEFWLIDGHHRVLGRLLKQEKEVLARVLSSNVRL